MWSLLKLLIVPAVEFVHRVELFLLFLTLVTAGSGSHLSLFLPLLSLVTETPGMAFNSALWTLIALLHFKRAMTKHGKRDIGIGLIQEWVSISPRNFSWFAGDLCTLWETHSISSQPPLLLQVLCWCVDAPNSCEGRASRLSGEYPSFLWMETQKIKVH